MPPPAGERRNGWEMFGLSFTALFLEMMVIRWVPSVVHLVAYYANLMLLSSFLGLGAGALAAGRGRKVFEWFPVLLACDIGMLLLDHNTVLWTSASEAHFFALPPSMANALSLVRIFAMNALLFVPLGQRMGILFDSMPRLRAYAWDLTGGLCGTLCFGVFSLTLFSPVIGIAGVMLVYLLLSTRRRLWFDAVILAAALAAVVWNGDRKAIWSPYYYITVSQYVTPDVTESAPPAEIHTMKDPPVYMVKVNQFGYHIDAAIDEGRYTAGSLMARTVHSTTFQYDLPYAIERGRSRILVVGAGGGWDVEAALKAGAAHVDAVEIDPEIVEISRRFNAGAPYSDPRVTVHIDDARSYLSKGRPGYDMVLFGFLDSQALFSTMKNVRLDGYVYTVEGIRSAFRLLNDKGMLTLSFYLGKPWLGLKLHDLVKEATGREPTLYFGDGHEDTLILCVPKDPRVVLPLQLSRFHQGGYGRQPHIDVPTDDWPFLYLIARTIPSDYVIAIASLLAFSIAALAWLRRRAFGRPDVFFGLLGMGFLLLETKSISDCTLFFGATWLVTLVVVSGVLLMVLAANIAAEHLGGGGHRVWMYAPLFATLAVLLFVPRESILGFEFTGRLLWALLVVPLPIFFAGIIFSTSFRDTESPSAVFGANLIGAMIGGFCEYLSMAIGNQRLSMLVIAAYLGSMLVMVAGKRRGQSM